MDGGSRQENAPNRKPRASVLIQSEPSKLELSRSSLVVAGTNAAHVVAVGVELANPAAAAIAAIVVAVVRSDRAADYGGADETGPDTPAEAGTPGFCLGGGGSEAAGDGKCSEGESGNFGFDRHEKLHPVACGAFGPHAGWTERLRIRFDPRAGNSDFRLFLCNHR